MSEDSNKLARSHDHGVMLLPDLAKEIESKLENNSSSTRTQIDLKTEIHLDWDSYCATHLWFAQFIVCLQTDD